MSKSNLGSSPQHCAAFALVIAGVVALAPRPVSAEGQMSMITIANPSFETPALGSGSSQNGVTTPHDPNFGWTGVGVGGPFHPTGTGNQVPTATDGNNLLFLHLADAGSFASDQSSAFQTAVPAGELGNGFDRYQLTFDVGNRALGGSSDAHDAITRVRAFFTLGDDNEDFSQAVGQTYDQLLSTIPNGDWATDQTIELDTAELSGAQLAESLNIVLQYDGPVPNSSNQALFDNVRLVGIAPPPLTPEPSSLALLLLGGSLFGLWRWQRNAG